MKTQMKTQKIKLLGILFLLCLLFTGCTTDGTTEDAEAEYGQTKTAKPSISENISDNTSEETLEVHYIDIGQGDATLIKCGGHAMLIDGGNHNMGTTVQLYLKNQGVESLDYVIGTHPDADHIGGLDVIVYKYDCANILLPDYEKDTKTYTELIDVIRERSYQITYPLPGTTYQLGDARFTILAPISNDYGSNANNYSIALRLTYGENSFLFTGDAEAESEAEMLKSGEELKADVYKVAHHGSDSANTQAFLDAVDPTYAVISCGEGNSYGHPHAEILNRLRQMGIETFRTDEQGSILAVSDGKEITWNTASSTTWQSGERSESDREDGTEEPSTQLLQKATGENSQSLYILNTNTKKFHQKTCQSADQIQEKNRQETELTREELLELGYEPCKNCNP